MTRVATLPNFFIIGAPKAGTTTVFQHLADHPQVSMGRRKEPCFFSFDVDASSPTDEVSRRRYCGAVRTLRKYEALFADGIGALAVGEASANYLANEGAARRIHETLPDAKLIAILRDPADRAYSAYWMDVRKGRERRSFRDVLDCGNAADPTARYVAEGMYFEQLSRYFDLFDADQISVLLMDDLKQDAVGVMQNIYRFLEIDDNFVPATDVVLNSGGVPRVAIIERLLAHQLTRRLVSSVLMKPAKTLGARLRGMNRVRSEPMPQDIRLRLEKVFQSDVEQLERLLQRDLSSWLPQRTQVLEASQK